MLTLVLWLAASPLPERHGHLLRQPECGAVGRSSHRAPLRLRLRGGWRERDGEARGLLQPLPSLRHQTGICLFLDDGKTCLGRWASLDFWPKREDRSSESRRLGLVANVENKRPDVLSVRVEGINDEIKTVTCKTRSVKVVGLKWAGVAIETEL